MPEEERLIFNHDLLMNEGDLAQAEDAFPVIASFLDWPTLKHAFKSHDDVANAQKKRSRIRGSLAIGAGLSALWLAALEPRLQDFHLVEAVNWMLAGVVVVLAICGLVLGSQILHGQPKHQWLHNRAAAERLRQLHFQFLVRRIVCIAAADEMTAVDLLAEREVILGQLKHDLVAGVTPAVDTIIEDLGSAQCWLVPSLEQRHALSEFDGVIFGQLILAYARLRFQHQLGYATKKLSEGYGLWPWEPEGQARRINETANMLTIAVIAAHLLAFVLIVFEPTTERWLTQWLQTIAIMAAMGVLALRIFDEGIRPRAEVARYRSYRGEVAELSRKFGAACDPVEQIEVMQRMEELAYRELRDFLTVYDQASFTL